MRLSLAFLVVGALLVGPAEAQDASPPYNARYLSGHSAFKGTFACQLVITPNELQIRIYAGIKGRDELKLAVPITQVVSAIVTIQDKHQIIVVTKTDTDTEALYFYVQDKKNASAVVARIDSAKQEAGR
jgi:hypothetical protein